MDSVAYKKALREELKIKRRFFIQKCGPKFLKSLNESLVVFFKNSVSISPSHTIAGYWPLSEEVDCRPLLYHLHDQNHICALPCIEDPLKPLFFRKWAPSDSLDLSSTFSSTLRLMQPSSQKEILLPDVVFVPLLGFDAQGHRIGYGGGFYDSTLQTLRTQKKIIAIGLGYTCQEVSSCLPESHDEKLDYVLTEQGIRSFTS